MIRQRLATHPLAAFFVLTFAISWGVPGAALALAAATGSFEVDFGEYTPLSYVAIWAPAISAFVWIALAQGRAGLLAYLRRIVRFPGHGGLYVVVLVGVPLLTFAAAALTHALGVPALAAPTISLGAFAAIALAKATVGPVEEFGWRGFALPLLQRRHTGLRAAIVLGFVWALWHLPALFVTSVMTGAFEGSLALAVLRLFVGVTAKSIIMTVLYNASGGSIALVFLYHWLGNLPYPWEADHGIFVAQDVFDVLLALILVATFRHRYLATNVQTEVTGLARERRRREAQAASAEGASTPER